MDIFTCYPVYRFINQEGFEISVILCGVYPYNNNEGLGSPFGMNRIGGITMQQKKESNHTEVISIEEYLTKRKKLRDLDKSQRWGGIPKEKHALVMVSCLVGN